MVGHPGWQGSARPFDDLGHFLKQEGNAARVAAQERHQSGNGQCDQAGHGHAEQCNRNKVASRDMGAGHGQQPEPRRHDVHQFVDQQAGDERGQQLQLENGNQGGGGDYPRGACVPQGRFRLCGR